MGRPKKRNLKRLMTAEALEDRRLLANDVIASFFGEISAVGELDELRVHATDDNFSIPSQATLGFRVSAQVGSDLVPNTVEVHSDEPGKVPVIHAELLEDGSSLVLAKLKHGAFTVEVAGLDQSTGAWRLDVFLAGDANGDHAVDGADTSIIRGLRGTRAGDADYRLEADTNRDGRITGFDLARARTNNGVSTSVRPLFLTAELQSQYDSGVLGDGIVNETPVVLEGATVTGALVALDQDGDGFDDGNTSAGEYSSGTNYQLSVNLSTGANQLDLRATDLFGQTAFASTNVILDDGAPSVELTNPPSGLLTNENLTIFGVVSDDLSGIQAITALVDTGTCMGPHLPNTGCVPLSWDSSGNFSFNTSFPLDGSADGPHQIKFEATDVAGNTSASVPFTFTLDTTPPVTPTLDLNPVYDPSPIGDRVTTLDLVTLDGSTEPNASVALIETGETVVADSNGGFSFSGVELLLGANVYSVQATDAAGNTSATFETEFTRVSSGPTPPSLTLDEASDTLPLGDNATSNDLVTIRGTTDPNLSVFLVEAGRQSQSNGAGEFSFVGVPLELGQNIFTVRVSDDFGNESSSTIALNRIADDGAIVLTEGNNFVVEQSSLVELGLMEGARTLSFDVAADFDETDSPFGTDDTFLVYLVDPADPSRTLLDRDQPGTAIFGLSPDGAEYRAGQVTYNGTRVSVDVTSLPNLTTGMLLFQLIGSDSDQGSTIAVSNIESILELEGSASPLAPAGDPLVPVATGVDLTNYQPITTATPLLENIRLDSATGLYKANLRLLNTGPDISRDLVIQFPNFAADVTLATLSGTDVAGEPYIDFFDAIPLGGLRSGTASSPIEIEVSTPNLSRIDWTPRVLSTGAASAPVLQPIGSLTVSLGDVLTIDLDAADSNGDQLQYSLQNRTDLPGVSLLASGQLRIGPEPGDEGEYQFTVLVSDGLLTDQQVVSLTVEPSDSANTQVSGVVLNTSETPLEGVPVQVGRFQTLTANDGSFTVSLPSFLTPTEAFDIPVPLGDPQFDPFFTGSQTIELRRAGFDPATGDSTGNPRLHPNLISTFLDGSVVYGSDAERANALRTFDGNGKLKTSVGDLLPQNNSSFFPGGTLENENNSPRDPADLFVAGDVRVNENVGLASLQTLFVREHNRKATELATADATKTGDEIYQQARRWVGALLQHITYNEYLPVLLGSAGLTPYAGYDPNADPSISGLFSGAAFRIGHSMSPGDVLRLAEDGTPLPGGALSLAEAFFNPDPILNDGIEPYLRGLGTQQIEEVDTLVRDELRNFLFGPPGAGGLDLVSLNLQRGRDLGLPSYNQARQDFGLPRVTGFSSITSDPSLQSALQAAYGSVDNIDVWAGGLAEDHVTESLVGELFHAIISDQFQRLRSADRFWYENSQFTADELSEIRGTTLRDVIISNTAIQSLPTSVFISGAAPQGPAAGGGSSTNVGPTETRSFNGTGNSLTNNELGAAGTNLRIDYTLDYADGISEPSGSDRPGAREISNGVFSQSQTVPNSAGATAMFMIWGQLLAHDSALTPGGTDDTIRIFGDALVGVDSYPFVAEKLPLMLEHDVYLGVNNVIDRPIYLPVLDWVNADLVTPTADSLVSVPLRDGFAPAEILVAAGSASDIHGQPFDGLLSITEVPAEQTPAALPPNLFPDLVVTIQPANLVFDVPAPLTLPNTGGWEPGRVMDLWSISPVTGEFEVVGQSEVSQDGATIETISGGIRNSSWHFVNDPDREPNDQDENDRNDDDGCENEETDCEGSSTIELHSGAVMEVHDLVSYQSLGQARQVRFVYDSLRADPRPIVHFGYDDVPAITGGGGDRFRLIAQMTVERGGFRYQVPGHAGGEYGLQGGEHFWKLPVGGGDIDAALQVDLRGQPSGVYDYTILSGLRRFNDEIFTGSSARSSDDIVHVNGIGNPFGNGWGITGVQEIVINPDGSALLIDGDGTELHFRVDASGEFLAPAGDFSLLEELPDGSFQRTTPNQTVYEFDTEHRLVSVRDRNANETRHVYDNNGFLTEIIDPVGLSTRFTYQNGYLSEVIDPADRTTQFEFDAAGNLVSIIDPDLTHRTWDYDSDFHMTTEIDKRGNQEQALYDFAGRSVGSIRKDGGRITVTPAQTQGLLPPNATSRPFPAPATFDLGGATATYIDPNGNVLEALLDSGAQLITSFDAEGPLPTVQRDTNNLITTQIDGRGFITNYEYDSRGNLTAIDDSTGTITGSGNLQIQDPGWALSRSIPFENATGAHFNPRDRFIYVAKRPGTAQGLYKIGLDDRVTQVAGFDRPAAVLVDPDDGDIFVTEDAGGLIYRTTFGSTGRQSWVSGFHAGDDDPIGMAIAPNDYNGSVLAPGQALVVDRGFLGDGTAAENEVWRFSPDVSEGEQVVHNDNGTLVNPLDVAITSSQVFIVDTGEESGAIDATAPGTIYEVGPGGSLTALVTSEALRNPIGIAHDPLTGDLLVVDDVDDRVVRVDPATGEVTTLFSGVDFPISWAGIDVAQNGNEILVTGREKIVVFNRLAAQLIDVHDDSWALAQSIRFVGGTGGHFNPRDGQLYVNKRLGSNLGLYAVAGDGGNRFIAPANRTNNHGAAGLVIDPDDGDIFVAEDSNGVIYRTAFGSTGRQGWVSGFHAGDDDPVAMAIAANDYTGDVLQPGEALMVDRGFQGEDEIWKFSPDTAGFQQVVHDDNGTLVNVTDVVITPNRVFVTDSGDDAFQYQRNGTIYEVGAGGSLTPIATSETLNEPIGIAYDPVTRELLVLDDVPGSLNGLLWRVNPDTGETNLLASSFGLSGANWGSIDVSPDGNRIVVTDANRDRIFIFDRQTDTLGRREFTYDSMFSQITSMTDELGRLTLHEIDPANGNLLSVTRVVGLPDEASEETDDVVTSYSYLSNGLVDTMTDPLGRVTDYDYDSLGRLTQVTFAVGTADESFRSYEYDAAGNRAAIVDENGNRTEFEYDDLDRVSRLIQADPDAAGPLTSPVTRFAYDAAGNLVETVDAVGSTTVREFDELGRLVRSSDSLANETVMEYDLGGNLVATTDPNGNTNRFAYDNRDRRAQAIDPDGGVTSFGYDNDNNLLGFTDSVGNRTVFSYDLRDRLIREVDPLGAETLYKYDAADNLILKADRNGRTTEFVYDDLDRLVQETWVNADDSLANEISRAYDKNGNLLAIADDVSSLAFSYDQRDRMTSTDNAGTLPDSGLPNVILTYTYDGVGNVTSVAEQIEAATGATTSYEYDGLNRNTSIQQSGGGANEKLVDLVYNQLGQFEEVSRYSALARSNLVARSDYSYDGINRLASLQHGTASDPRAIAFYDYEYDAASRISAIADIDGNTEYGYNDRDQLTRAFRDTSDVRGDESYDYDENGNRTANHVHGNGYFTGVGNRLLYDDTYEYEYDGEGNIVRRILITTGDYREFSYDHRNRLIHVADFSTTGDSMQNVGFSYDTLDRRIAKTIASNDAESTTYFVYDRESVALDFLDLDGSAVQQPELGLRYLHGPTIDQVLAQEDVQFGQTQWLLTDHLGTAKDIVDDTGNVLNHVLIDSFGNIVGHTGSLANTRYVFTGREFDAEIGLHYHRARYYDATTGRFISEDPIHSSTLPFAYADNSPLLFVDLDGRNPVSWGRRLGKLADKMVDLLKKKDKVEKGKDIGDAIGEMDPTDIVPWDTSDTQPWSVDRDDARRRQEKERAKKDFGDLVDDFLDLDWRDTDGDGVPDYMDDDFSPPDADGDDPC